MKFIVKVLLVLSAIVPFGTCKTMSWGNLQPRNLLLFDQFFHQKQKPDENSEKITNDLEFTSKPSSLITAIHVTDLTWHQDGGHVRIIQGGIGFTFVKLQLISESNMQILLNIEIFGK